MFLLASQDTALRVKGPSTLSPTTTPVTEGKCCLHRACLGQEYCLWVICQNPELYTRKMEDWGVLEPLEQSQKGPRSSSILLCSAEFRNSELIATAVLYGMQDLPPSHRAGMCPGCVWAQLERRKRDKTASCVSRHQSFQTSYQGHKGHEQPLGIHR